MLGLLPPCPGSPQESRGSWRELRQSVYQPLCKKLRPPLRYGAPKGGWQHRLYSSPILHLVVCLCVCVSTSVCLAETDKDCPSALFSRHLSIKGGRGLAEIDSGLRVCHTQSGRLRTLCFLSSSNGNTSNQMGAGVRGEVWYPAFFFHTTKPEVFLLSHLKIYAARKADFHAIYVQPNDITCVQTHMEIQFMFI